MYKLIRMVLCAALLNPVVLKAQEEMSFEMILTPGDSLRQEGDLTEAVKAYKKSIIKGNVYAPGDQSVERVIYFADMYNLACALSRMGQQDSAVKYLERFTLESHDSVSEALTDPDLVNIRQAVQWPKLEDRIIKNYCANSKTQIKDLAYAKLLWHMRAGDQAYYEDMSIAEQKTGRVSSVVTALWDLKRKINEESQRLLEAQIKIKGWPKISQVGKGPATAAFLVMQHADLEKQVKYLPVIEGLCKQGEAAWKDYALMYDRVQVESGKPQRYGSQVQYNNDMKKYELSPLEDKSRVDEWRKEVGLQELSVYLKNWNIVWPE